MKQMPACDFEDVLQVRLHTLFTTLHDVFPHNQCAIPAFDGLLPEPHNTNVLALLKTCASWHAMAKLRMHTDETLKLLDNMTVRLGKQLRHFVSHTCLAFKTQELKCEAEHCQHQQLRSLTGNGEAVASTPQAAWQPKTFNLQTYKLHALGDYSASIQEFGTTDSYSTEPVGEHFLTVFSTV
jgi:hypothetical protein